MTVEVKLFAVARQLANCETLRLELPREATVADVRRAVVRQIPELKILGDHLRFSIDYAYADDETPVRQDSEVACIPPVSGG